jgi:hypothetical protein
MSGVRRTHADFMPAEIAPMTSKVLLEMSHALSPVVFAFLKK